MSLSDFQFTNVAVSLLNFGHANVGNSMSLLGVNFSKRPVSRVTNYPFHTLRIVNRFIMISKSLVNYFVIHI